MHDLIDMQVIETQGDLVEYLKRLVLFYSFMLLEVCE